MQNLIDKMLTAAGAACAAVLAAPVLALAVGMLATIYTNGGLF